MRVEGDAGHAEVVTLECHDALRGPHVEQPHLLVVAAADDVILRMDVQCRAHKQSIPLHAKTSSLNATRWALAPLLSMRLRF